jgi:hypothetical protein
VIPLYSAAGGLLGWVAPEWCEEHAAHLRLVRTRRARAVVRAYLKPDSPMTGWLEATARRSSYGAAFQQALPCGRRTWALKGTPGSR